MVFKRDNNKNKSLYYQIYIVVELFILFLLYYYGIHWFLLLLLTPTILLDTWSNMRCARRQKKFIREIEITDEGIKCVLANKSSQSIPIEKCLFSIREKKFEKEKTEIEIRSKRLLKSKLIGRLHIKHWSQIPEIKNELLKHSITQIKYRPEGYWSKYGTLTADVVITTTAFTIAAVADVSGDLGTASGLRADGFMPIHHIKDNLKIDEDK
ncbi:MAG: hypothetical protein HEP71_13155 [Roseivirga sp.]|nr:hypothetical protein [Roseivirga sp.]